MLALPEKAIATMARPMGRPALGVKATTLRLSEGQGARIDALCGPGKRADFIREAVEAELTRRERDSLSRPLR